jgi:hypothetical protein
MNGVWWLNETVNGTRMRWTDQVLEDMFSDSNIDNTFDMIYDEQELQEAIENLPFVNVANDY